jgi:hypothetical protein
MITPSRYTHEIKEEFSPLLYWASRLNYFHKDAYKIALISTRSRYGALGYEMVYKYFQYKTYFYNATASLRESYVEKEKVEWKKRY